MSGSARHQGCVEALGNLAQIMHWDDFKFFSAVARNGSVRGAARELGVNPSTVTRRIEQFEARLGARLFSRTARGLVLTSAGSGAVDKVQSIESDLGRIERSIREEDQALVGTVRIAAPEFLMLGGVLDEYGRVADAYSRIAVEWLFEAAGPALTAGNGDLGVEATANPPLDLVGRRIGAVTVTAYAARTRQGFVNPGRSSRWLEWLRPGDLAQACEAVRASNWADARVACRCGSLSQLVALLAGGAGVSALPCIVGDREAGLQRLPNAPLETCDLWLLIAPEVRYARRVRLLAEYLTQAIATRATELAGESAIGAMPQPDEKQRPETNAPGSTA